MTLSKETKATLDVIVEGKPLNLNNSFFAIERLYQWADNADESCTLWNLYLDLIGYSEEVYGCSLLHLDVYSVSQVLGYQELCHLGDALKVFEDDGYESVYKYIDHLISTGENED